MTNEDMSKPKGIVEMIVENKEGKVLRKQFNNVTLEKGREALAAGLANEIGDEFNFFISRMLFGDNGTTGGVPKFVDTERNGLFGTTRVNKPVISTIDPNNPSQVVFTSIITFDEGNGFTLNEMALQMNSGDLYSMATFAGISKTSSLQITFNWRLFFV